VLLGPRKVRGMLKGVQNGLLLTYIHIQFLRLNKDISVLRVLLSMTKYYCEPQRDTDRTNVARKKKVLKILKAIDETEMLELPPNFKKKKSSKAREQMKEINERKRKLDQ